MLGDAVTARTRCRRYAARTLPRYMVPHAVRALDALPLTANGKVDRAALLDGAGPDGSAAPARVAAAATPRSREVERELLRIVGEVSGATGVGPDTRLFDLELSSVHLIRLATELERAFGARPSLEQLYRLADLGELVEFYAAAPEAPEAAAPATEVVLDEAARAEVKRRRRERPAPAGTGVVLRLPAPDPDRAETLLGRRTVRSFAPGGLDVRALAGWLECLREHETADGPRHGWASAGGAYPIDFYLQVHNPLPGLSTGVYRYDPRGHDLTLLRTEPVVTPDHHWSDNRRIHAEAAFALLHDRRPAGHHPAVRRPGRALLPHRGRRVAQLLAGRGDGIGVCPVGFVDFGSAAEELGLGPDHRLVYTLLGGAPGPPSGAGAGARAGADAPAPGRRRRRRRRGGCRSRCPPTSCAATPGSGCRR